MFSRIEVAMRPEFSDPAAQGLLRRLELAHPEIRRKVRWARLLDIYWIDLPPAREELIAGITEIYWDPVLQWLFSGNLIPSAAGKNGNILDLLECAPNRPGKFWGLERRFRAGVTDNVGRTSLEAFEIVLGKKLPDGRASSGSLLLLEGPLLTEDLLGQLARDVFCNELIETWTLLSEVELKKSDRFHQERIKRDFHKPGLRSSDQVEEISLEGLSDVELESLSQKKLWALSLVEMRAIRNYFNLPEVKESRKNKGLSTPTDVELEVFAQTWSEHCKHKIFSAKIHYKSTVSDRDSLKERNIPKEIDGLFKTTITSTTSLLTKPWLLSVFHDNAGIVAFDDEDAFCIKVETHNSPSALDPYGGALTGIVGVNRDILGCGLGAKPIFNTDVFCLAAPDYSDVLPDRILHPRRILDGVRRGVEHGGNKSGIPTINGALVFDDRFLGKPLIFCGTAGFMPRMIGERRCEVKEIRPGDFICMVGGRIGKDGIHGATFSSLPLSDSSPVTAVQLGDPITQKRTADFLLEARDLGLYRAITDNGAGGLSSSVGELALLSGGAKMDVSLAKIKYPGLKPYELVVSESQERMTVAVPPEKAALFMSLAERRGVEVSQLGTFTQTGQFEISYAGKIVASLDLRFLHQGAPKLELQAVWKGRPQFQTQEQLISQVENIQKLFQDSCEKFKLLGSKALCCLLDRPNIASKEWLIRQYDHEVQGMSVIKPLHTVSPGTAASQSGPNDAGVVKPKLNSVSGIAVGCGINPKLSDIDPYLMAQSAVDEAVRNVLCVGAEFGRPESVLALVDNFCWPDPVGHPEKTAALVRACYGLQDAALSLSAPMISGKDSMKNDFKGRRQGRETQISVLPTLLMTAVAKVADIRFTRTADFKRYGDSIYLLGLGAVLPENSGGKLGLLGSEFYELQKIEKGFSLQGSLNLSEPDWKLAQKIYSWIGGARGKKQSLLSSLHDVSEGGLLTAVAESLLARGFGATLYFPKMKGDLSWRPNCLWEFGFGEGFHTFIASAAEADLPALEAEWDAEGVPYFRLGTVMANEKLEVHWDLDGVTNAWSVSVKELREAWKKGGYWE